ncbi:hypothetical protein IP84_04510 [beta proteobacterium AAP99]|nr:hypothetical protein IP84_04510 [beta proteobacterium AAP99]
MAGCATTKVEPAGTAMPTSQRVGVVALGGDQVWNAYVSVLVFGNSDTMIPAAGWNLDERVEQLALEDLKQLGYANATAMKLDRAELLALYRDPKVRGFVEGRVQRTGLDRRLIEYAKAAGLDKLVLVMGEDKQRGVDHRSEMVRAFTIMAGGGPDLEYPRFARANFWGNVYTFDVATGKTQSVNLAMTLPGTSFWQGTPISARIDRTKWSKTADKLSPEQLALGREAIEFLLPTIAENAVWAVAGKTVPRPPRIDPNNAPITSRP